jgi:hypothetical protein
MFEVKISIADPGCLSRIPDPDFFPFQNPDPITTTRVGKNKLIVFLTYLCFVTINFTKNVNYLFLEQTQ